MKLYPVLHCGQVKVLRKINFYSLVTTMYSGGGGGGGEGPQSKYLFFYSEQEARSKIFLTCCIKHGKYKGLQTLVSEKVPHWS